jgi:hypothetical protein
LKIRSLQFRSFFKNEIRYGSKVVQYVRFSKHKIIVLYIQDVKNAFGPVHNEYFLELQNSNRFGQVVTRPRSFLLQNFKLELHNKGPHRPLSLTQVWLYWNVTLVKKICFFDLF